LPELLAGGECELGVDVSFGSSLMAVCAAGTAGLGATAERLVDDALDGAHASPALDGATKTTIDLLGATRQIFRGADSAADIMVGQDVAGTNNHEKTAGPMVMQGHRYSRRRTDAKGKTGF
jgi:hypothetical protein